MTTTIQLALGATEADIIKALASLKSGGTLILPQDETIKISTGLTVDVTSRNITLDLNGSTLVKAGNVTVITGAAAHDPVVGVKLAEDASNHTTVTYSKLPIGLHVGSWVKIVSDDGLPGDLQDANQAKMGQALQVASISGNTVTFKGELIDQDCYKTNVRASTYQSGELVVKNGEIVGDRTHTAWNSPLVQLRGVVNGHVENLNLHDGVGRGISVVDGVNNSMVDIRVKNMIDGGSAALGIGITSLSSTGTSVDGYYAENVTAATDDDAMGVAANTANVAHYGGDIGMHVEDAVAYATRNMAYSWHSESVQGSYKHVMAFDSFGFLMARGIGGSMVDSGGANNLRGIQLYEYGTGDSRNITIDNVTLKETQNYALYSSKNPVANVVKNSIFESALGNLATAKAATITNTTFAKTSANANDVINGTDKADLLLGGKGADIISGGAGDDYIWGGAGIDTLTGGAGRDRFAFHSLGEVGDTIADFETGGRGDVIDLSVMMAKYSWPAGDPIANGYVRFVQSGANTQVQVDAAHTGSFVTLATLSQTQASALSVANLRVDLAADDTIGAVQAPTAVLPHPEIIGSTDNDVLQGDAATIHIAGLAGDDHLIAYSQNTLLEGGTGNDTLTGAAGNDVLDGGTGNDVMAGGAGDDVYYVDSTADVVSEDAGAGFDRIVTGIQLDGPLAANVEALTLTGTADLNGVGNGLDNVIVGNNGNNILLGGGGNDTLYGGVGNDVLDGGTGNDHLYGGTGDDVYYVDSGGDVVTENAGEGHDTIITGVQLNGPLATNVEDLTLTGSANLTATGNELDNVITGNDGDNLIHGDAGSDILYGGGGNDTLYGDAGSDTLYGGGGDDTYYVDSAGDLVIENPGEGHDTIVTGAQLDGPLAANVEDLTLTGSANLSATGNELDNVITGNAGDNIIHGGAGSDVLYGGGGNDALYGDADNDRLYGGAGNDILDGGDGSNTLIGGTGDDTYYVNSASDVVIENPGEGHDTIITGIQLAGTLSTNVEDVVLTGTDNLTVTGNELDNTITGNSGNNTLYGGVGNDTLYGGEGKDNMMGDTGNDILSGGDGDDRMLGGDGNDILDGGQGADTLNGGLGSDTATYANSDQGVTADLSNYLNNSGGAKGDYFSSIENLTGSAHDDVLTGNSTANVLDGGAGNDHFYGGGGNDTIYGGSGADWLEGGAGKDVLNGGEGNDNFYFASITDGGDTIADFHPGADKIALSATGFGISSLNDVAFISGANVAATTTKATLIYNTTSGQLLWDADGSGAQKAQLLATLADAPHLSHSDFAVA